MPRRNSKTKIRRHTNNHARRGISRGKYYREMKRLAKELGIPFGKVEK